MTKKGGWFEMERESSFTFSSELRYFYSLFQKPLPYPKCVLFILGNELCERFSFYGMKGRSF